MAQYIKKSEIVAEIKKRIKECDKLANAAADNNLSNTQQANELLIRQYTSLLHFLDTLGTKEVDLEKEIKKYIEDNICGYCVPGVEETAKYFFELGMAASNKVHKGE